MRHLIYGILASLLLVMPAAAQSGSSATSSKTSQDQAAKTGKDAAAKAGQPTSDPARQAAPAPPAAKDDSLSNYDVNGSNASDAMGASR